MDYPSKLTKLTKFGDILIIMSYVLNHCLQWHANTFSRTRPFFNNSQFTFEKCFVVTFDIHV